MNELIYVAIEWFCVGCILILVCRYFANKISGG